MKFCLRVTIVLLGISLWCMPAIQAKLLKKNRVSNRNITVQESGFSTLPPMLGVEDGDGDTRCAMPITGPTIITQAGVYRLAAPVIGPIVIQGSDITLDLAGYAVTTVGDISIHIINSQDVTVFNGYLIDTGTSGLGAGLVINNSTRIVCSYLNIVNFSGTGIWLQPFSVDNTIEHCMLSGVLFANSVIGILLDLQSTQNIVQNCIIRDYQFSGIVVGTQSLNNVIRNNTLINNNTVNDANSAQIYITDSTATTNFILNNFFVNSIGMGLVDFGTNSVIYGNFAQNNVAGNYSSAITLQVTTPTTTIGGLSNVSLVVPAPTF